MGIRINFLLIYAIKTNKTFHKGGNKNGKQCNAADNRLSTDDSGDK